MGTALWGPDTWYVIHVIADSSPDTFKHEDTKAYEQFYRAIGNVLPCPSCAIHYKQFIEKHPPIFKTRVEALVWTVKAHNHANEMTGARVLSEEEGLIAIQEEIRARDTGLVRGRRPTLIERLWDASIPFVVGIGIGILVVLLILRK
jgi:mitochondrial FAD-linked sulfhydryl oxidase